MNVKELIEELQKLPPHLPVRGYMTCVSVLPDGDKVTEYHEIECADTEAQEVGKVEWRGYDVCLECSGMAAPH